LRISYSIGQNVISEKSKFYPQVLKKHELFLTTGFKNGLPIRVHQVGHYFGLLARLELKINLSFKGTVRPDWICMRVVSLKSPLKGHQPLYVLNFLFLTMNF
jgi:hypothetical protein